MPGACTTREAGYSITTPRTEGYLTVNLTDLAEYDDDEAPWRYRNGALLQMHINNIFRVENLGANFDVFLALLRDAPRGY